MQQEFQKVAKDNKVGWMDCREILFEFKKTLDQWYRNMFWHLRFSHDCEKCNYWDTVYAQHMAKVNDVSNEITDEEMLEAVDDMEVDGSN